MKRSIADPEPTVSIPVLPGQVEAFPFTPGHCAVHPDQELVTHKDAGLREPTYWGPDPRRVVCRSPFHAGAPLDALRCTWCGGRLHPANAPTWGLSDRKTYCRPLCRLQAFRAKGRTPTDA